MDPLLIPELVRIKWLLLGILICALLVTVTVIYFCKHSLSLRRQQLSHQVKQVFINDAQEYLDKGLYSSLFDLCQQRTEDHPNDTAALWYLGQAQYKQQRYGEALKSFRQIQSIDPSFDKYAVEDFIEEIGERLTGPTGLM